MCRRMKYRDKNPIRISTFEQGRGFIPTALVILFLRWLLNRRISTTGTNTAHTVQQYSPPEVSTGFLFHRLTSLFAIIRESSWVVHRSSGLAVALGVPETDHLFDDVLLTYQHVRRVPCHNIFSRFGSSAAAVDGTRLFSIFSFSCSILCWFGSCNDCPRCSICYDFPRYRQRKASCSRHFIRHTNFAKTGEQFPHFCDRVSSSGPLGPKINTTFASSMVSLSALLVVVLLPGSGNIFTCPPQFVLRFLSSAFVSPLPFDRSSSPPTVTVLQGSLAVVCGTFWSFSPACFWRLFTYR